MIEHISYQSNLFAIQSNSNFQTIPSEIERYFGIFLMMGIVIMPRYEMYWSEETRFAPIADVLSRALQRNYSISAFQRQFSNRGES